MTLQAQACFIKAHDFVLATVVEHAHAFENDHRGYPGQSCIHRLDMHILGEKGTGDMFNLCAVNFDIRQEDANERNCDGQTDNQTCHRVPEDPVGPMQTGF
jgi:hypothetical protein